jgi:hypothetical protein
MSKSKFPGWRTMTGAQRYNAKAAAIFAAARAQGHITLTCQDPKFTEGAKAHADGVKWWDNPYPSGSPAAYEWDKGHTAARRSA